jgi:hypothetical protein
VKAARFQQDHGQGVAHGQGDGGAGGGGHVEGAGFRVHRDQDDLVAAAGQRVVAGAAHADDGDLVAFEGGQQVQQLLGFAAVAEGQYGVAVGHDAEFAVHGVGGVQEDGRAARAGQGGGDLLADGDVLAHAGDHDLAPRGQGGQQPVHRLVKVLAQGVPHLVQTGYFDIQRFARAFDVLHKPCSPGQVPTLGKTWLAGFQPLEKHKNRGRTKQTRPSRDPGGRARWALQREKTQSLKR